MALAPHVYITPEEYLARERAAESRSEYYAGEIFDKVDFTTAEKSRG